MKIFITGSSGCLAQALLPALCGESFVECVTGIDVVPARVQPEKFSGVQMDMRSPEVARLMKDHDAVVHLGFAISQGKLTLEEMRDINVEGTRNVVHAACSNDISSFINMSSVSVYGPGECMREDDVLHPHPWFPYAQHKVAVEEMIRAALPRATQFRAQLIIGKNAQDFLRKLFFLPVWLDFGATPPQQQVVHESDVVQAIIGALKNPVGGTFNLAAAETISLGGDYIRRGVDEGMKIRRMPFGVVRTLATGGKHILKKDLLTLISMLGTTATVSCDAARDVLGWTPARSAWDARRDAMQSVTSTSKV